MKIRKIVPQICKEKQDAFWYFGNSVIAEVTHLSRKVIIVTDGNISVKVDAKLYNGNKALQKVTEMGLHDKDLQSIEFKSVFCFDFVYQNTETGKTETLANDECYEYSDAINHAKSFIIDDKNWIDGTIFPNRVTTIGIPENMLKYQIKGEKFIPPKRSDRT